MQRIPSLTELSIFNIYLNQNADALRALAEHHIAHLNVDHTSADSKITLFIGILNAMARPLHTNWIFMLASTEEGRSLLEAHGGVLQNWITAEDLNHIIPSGPYLGLSPLFCLADHRDGIYMLKKSYHLHSCIGEKALNHIIPHGTYADLSVAFVLASSEGGVCILEQNRYRLANLINEEALNHIVAEGDYQGESVAYWLSLDCDKSSGFDIFTQKNHRLLNLIRAETFNHVNLKEENLGFSVAYGLLRHEHAYQFYRQNDNRLARLLNANVLNQISPEHQSIAMSLVSMGGLLDIFELNQFRLLYLLQADTLNHVFTHPAHRNESVAFWLSYDSQGIALLKRDNFRLANLISAETANQITQNIDQNGGESVLFNLAANAFQNQDYSVFKANDARLARLINQNALNELGRTFEYCNASVAFYLAASPDGFELLALDNNRLIACLNARVLNAQIIDDNPFELAGGQSLAYRLTLCTQGLNMLAANQYRLINLLHPGTLNAVFMTERGTLESVGLSLARQEVLGWPLLCANDYRLARALEDSTQDTGFNDEGDVTRGKRSRLANLPPTSEMFRFFSYASRALNQRQRLENDEDTPAPGASLTDA